MHANSLIWMSMYTEILSQAVYQNILFWEHFEQSSKKKCEHT